jgi:hypothetical protein
MALPPPVATLNAPAMAAIAALNTLFLNDIHYVSDH